MKFAIAVILAIFAFQCDQISGSLEDNKEITKKCLKEVGTTEGSLDKDEGKYKCYIVCLHREANLIDKEGNFQIDAYLKFVRLGKIGRQPFERCVALHKDVSDICERVSVTTGCFQEVASHMIGK